MRKLRDIAVVILNAAENRLADLACEADYSYCEIIRMNKVERGMRALGWRP